MSSAEIQLILQKVDTISQENAFIKLKLEQIDENKYAKQQCAQMYADLQQEKSVSQSLRTELEIYKQKQQKTQLISANSAKSGSSFEDVVEESMKKMFITYERTSSSSHSGDFIGFLENEGYMIDAKYKNSSSIPNADITKLAANARDHNVKAAILVYNELPAKYGELVDFKYHNQENAPTEFNKEMFFACSLQSFTKTLLIAVSRSRILKQLPQYDAEMLTRMSNLFKQAMQFHIPLFSSYTKNEFQDFCTQFATDGHSLLKYCSYQNPNDSDQTLIKVKQIIKEELTPLFPTRKVGKGNSTENLFGPYPLQKRKLDCDQDDTPSKKTKFETTS